MNTSFDIKKVQKRLLAMAIEIRNILEKHDIPYQIAFGTLLGAVRHGGFIPWDDDFDFILFDDTYDEAIRFLLEELPNDMFLENEQTEPHYFHAWSHVKDVNTICQCDHYIQDSYYVHKGLSVDLYRIKKLKKCEFADFRYQHAKAYLARRKSFGFISENEYNEKQKRIKEQFFKELMSSEDLILAYPFDIGIQQIEDVFPLMPYLFEGESFLGPNNADGVLTLRYGNYKELPPEKDRTPHYSSVRFK